MIVRVSYVILVTL